MDEDRNFDIVTLRKSRSEKLRDSFGHSFGWVRKRGWIEVEAEVLECSRPPKSFYYRNLTVDETLLPGSYVVSFQYSVNGKTYQGILGCQDEVQKGDKFPIKCNPRNPEENNTIDSQSNWTVEYTKFLDGFLILLFLALFAWNLFLHK